MNNENWINHKIFQHKDVTFGSGSGLNIEIVNIAKQVDNNFVKFENQIEPVGLSVRIFNDVSKSKSILFTYYDCIGFVTRITKLIKNISKVPIGTVYTLKKKKQLLIELVQTHDASNSRVLKIIISDSDNDVVFTIISVKVLYVISVLFKNYVQSYINMIYQASINYNLCKIRSGLKTIYKNDLNLNNNVSIVASKISNIMDSQSKQNDKDYFGDTDQNQNSDLKDQNESQNESQNEDHQIGMTSQFNEFFNSKSFDYVLEGVDDDLKKS